MKHIERKVKQMTLEEKASFCAGKDLWSTPELERLSIAARIMTDGPHGVRKPSTTDDADFFHSHEPATCFPTASGMGSSWNVELVREVGVALGKECKQFGVHILLGPGINMKRSPLAGRNFEYYSEDPVLSGELAAAYINGLQSEHVAACVKHYACYNTEHERMTISSEMDERTLREIYLAAFERVIKKANPWALMTSYNKVNGTYTSEHEHLLQEILRQEWGYEGVVISDWSGVNDRILSLKMGLDLEMPGPALYNAKKIVEYVQAEKLSEDILDASVIRLLRLEEKTNLGSIKVEPVDFDAHHLLARRAASESIVLLKNESGILPLRKTSLNSIAVIGNNAKFPRFQGAGSSKVTPYRTETPYDEIVKQVGDRIEVRYEQGYHEHGSIDEDLLNRSIEVAKLSDFALLFVGLPELHESESRDRTHLDLPKSQIQLIKEVSSVQPNCVVIVSSGAAVAMKEWIDSVPAVFQAWLTGQGHGGAIADLLFGNVNPSGKLTETFPARLQDTPAYLTFPGENGKAIYGEGIFTGYRYYDKKAVEPLFPFGHGLSYTQFVYSDLQITEVSDGLQVVCTVENVGEYSGKEVVQLYLSDQHSQGLSMEQELKGFNKIDLRPGERKQVTFRLEKRDFSTFHVSANRWVAGSGFFSIRVGSSSRDIRLESIVNMTFTDLVEPALDLHSMVNEWLSHKKGKRVLYEFLEQSNPDVIKMIENDIEAMAFIGVMPLIRVVVLYSKDRMLESPEVIVNELLNKIGYY